MSLETNFLFAVEHGKLFFIDWPAWELGIKAPYNIHWDWKLALELGAICPGLDCCFCFCTYPEDKAVQNNPENLDIITGIGRLYVKNLRLEPTHFFAPSSQVIQSMAPILQEFEREKSRVCFTLHNWWPSWGDRYTNQNCFRWKKDSTPLSGWKRPPEVRFLLGSAYSQEICRKCRYTKLSLIQQGIQKEEWKVFITGDSQAIIDEVTDLISEMYPLQYSAITLHSVPKSHVLTTQTGTVGHIYYDAGITGVTLRSFTDFFLLTKSQILIHTKGSLFGQKAGDYGEVSEVLWIEDSLCDTSGHRACYPDDYGRCW